MAATITTRTLPALTVPGAVWTDYLDPLASGMQAELGLASPEWRRVGKGSQAVYRDVPVDVAADLAEYLVDRAQTLIGNEEPEYRGVHRAAIRVAGKINDLVRLERLRERNGR